MERKIPGKRCVSRASRQSRKRPGCIRLFVCPTTGGRLEISVSPQESILGLKAALARKLRTSPNRISLIYREKALTSGRIVDHAIPEDSQLTLLPNMESGLSLQQSEKSISQALENLTEAQVNEFLSGRAPLTLAIRMGEHMVFVQLQLSTLQGQGQSASQPRPQVTPMTPASATLLSQSGLSASALAQATRCLSQRIHRLHGISRPATDNGRGASGSAQVQPQTATNQNPATAATAIPPPPPTSSLPGAPKRPIPSPIPAPPKARSSKALTVPALAAAAQPKGPLTSLAPIPPTLAPGTSPLPSPPPSPGAVIDSMKHVGSGIYSGTFSGTLDPSLQDASGRPRRSVSTILHILNDLLVAAPSSPVIGQTPTPLGTPTTAVPPGLSHTAHLTPPPSPTATHFTGVCPIPENSDNVLLRDKMQRVQMMLAQRKERRLKRRQVNSPYSTQKLSLPADSSLVSAPTVVADGQELPTMTTPTNSSCCPSSSSSSSSATSACTERPRSSSHVDNNCECSGSYSKTSLEQDSLVV